MKSTWSVCFKTLYSCFCSSNFSLSEREFSQQFDGFFSREEPPETESALTVFERRIQCLAQQCAVTFRRSKLKEIADLSVEAWQQYVALDPASHKTLATLCKGRTLGLISNFEHPRHVHRVLTEHRLSSFFETIVVSGAVGIKKPDPRIFELALEQTGLSSSEVVYIGDTADDIAGAQAAGILPILLRRPYQGTDPETLDFRSGDSDATSTETKDPWDGVLILDCLEGLIGMLRTE